MLEIVYFTNWIRKKGVFRTKKQISFIVLVLLVISSVTYLCSTAYAADLATKATITTMEGATVTKSTTTIDNETPTEKSKATAPIVEVVKEAPVEKITSKVTVIGYGISGMGQQLNCVKIEPPVVTSRILIVFGVHGFEDCYSKDGQSLVNMGNLMIQHFTNYYELLANTALYIVPCANPDGLINGWTNNGPGRCQMSLGVDINRDFDYFWISRGNSRNKTSTPFSAPESRALRDLVIDIQPNDVIDIHGWLATTYGDASLTKFFSNTVGIGRSSGLYGCSGYFSAWAMGHAERTALVELPDPSTDPQCVIKAVVDLCASRVGSNQ